MPGRRRWQAQPNPAGAHFLRDRELISALVRSAGAGAGSLALDLGAGYGAITQALAAAGAKVVAVERDPRLAAQLRRRFGTSPGIHVVGADLRCVPLPRRDFLVVASPPFSATTALCRRLFGGTAVPLARAELILAWGAARWLANPRPRDAESAWWASRYEISMTRRVRASSFLPPPATDAAQVCVRRRPGAESAAGQRELRRLLRSAYACRDEPLDQALRRLEHGGRASDSRSGHRSCEPGLSPHLPAALLTADDWYKIGRHWPPAVRQLVADVRQLGSRAALGRAGPPSQCQPGPGTGR